MRHFRPLLLVLGMMSFMPAIAFGLYAYVREPSKPFPIMVAKFIFYFPLVLTAIWFCLRIVDRLKDRWRAPR